MDQVRIKDKMRSAYTPQQWTGAQIEKIKMARFSETLKLAGWEIREAIYHGPGNYEWLDQQWRPYQIGDEWGGENRTAFFRCEVKVPENFGGKYGVLHLKPGGEGLLTLNGKQLAGLDSKHEVVFLAEQMKGGETLQIEIEQSVNEMEIPRIVHQFSVAELAVLDRDIEDAYFDLQCAYEVVMTPQAGSEVRAFLFDELKKAISLIDPSTTLQAVIASEAKQSPSCKEEIASSQKTLLAMTRAEQLPFKIVDANGSSVPFQVLSQDDGRVRVLIEARDVPPMGYTVYRLVAGQPDVSTPFIVHDESAADWKVCPTCIENDFFQVRFDEQGIISGIYDKKNSREVVEEGNRFQLFEDVPGRYAAWDIVPMYKDREFELPPIVRSEVVESGPVRLVLRQERSVMKSPMVQNIILYRRLPRIDFETEIEWGERDRLLKAGFLVNVNAMRATYDISCGYIERPTHANTSWDAAKFEVCGHLWADLSEGDYGVSLLNDCKYGYDIFGHRMRLTLLRGPQSPDPTADLGHHSFTYSLYPHRGDWRQAETPRRAWELNDPPIAIPIGGGQGGGESSSSFLSIVSDHVMLSALKMAEKGDGLILRFYEDQNRRGTVNVAFFHPISRAVECDPYENETGRADVVSGCLRFDIKPFEVRTFKLDLSRLKNSQAEDQREDPPSIRQ